MVLFYLGKLLLNLCVNKRQNNKTVVLFCLHYTTEQTKQHLETWARRSARPMIHFFNSRENSTVTVILRTRHSRTSIPEKTNYWKNRDRVTPPHAMVSPLGL